MTADRTENALLIERCLKGDRKACFELYGLYAKAMFNICMRITNDRPSAEDALQETFIKVFRNLGHFDKNQVFGAWVKRIAVNTALTNLKQNKSLKLFEEAAELAEIPETLDEASFKVEKIKRAVTLLPDGYRVVLSLYLFEGYDHTEIAGILGIAEESSRSQYSRARKKLLQILTGDEIFSKEKHRP